MSSNYDEAWSISMVKVRYPDPLIMHMGFGVLMGFLLSQNLFEERSIFKQKTDAYYVFSSSDNFSRHL